MMVPPRGVSRAVAIGRSITAAITIFAVVTVVIVIGGMRPAMPTAAGHDGELCFEETGKCVRGSFLAYWRENGGARQFGFPITDEFHERSAPPPAGNGQPRRVQYFERARFEYHEELVGTQSKVVLGSLGSEQFAARYGPTPVTDSMLAFEGQGGLKTELFQLRGGNYQMRWTAKNPHREACYFGGWLKNGATSAGDQIADYMIAPGETRSAHSFAYNLSFGQYYVDVVTTCDWFVTIAPQ